MDKYLEFDINGDKTYSNNEESSLDKEYSRRETKELIKNKNLKKSPTAEVRLNNFERGKDLAKRQLKKSKKSYRKDLKEGHDNSRKSSLKEKGENKPNIKSRLDKFKKDKASGKVKIPKKKVNKVNKKDTDNMKTAKVGKSYNQPEQKVGPKNPGVMALDKNKREQEAKQKLSREKSKKALKGTMVGSPNKGNAPKSPKLGPGNKQGKKVNEIAQKAKAVIKAEKEAKKAKKDAKKADINSYKGLSKTNKKSMKSVTNTSGKSLDAQSTKDLNKNKSGIRGVFAPLTGAGASTLTKKGKAEKAQSDKDVKRVNYLEKVAKKKGITLKDADKKDRKNIKFNNKLSAAKEMAGKGKNLAGAGGAVLGGAAGLGAGHLLVTKSRKKLATLTAKQNKTEQDLAEMKKLKRKISTAKGVGASLGAITGAVGASSFKGKSNKKKMTESQRNFLNKNKGKGQKSTSQD
jgi:hypothetical protein